MKRILTFLLTLILMAVGAPAQMPSYLPEDDGPAAGGQAVTVDSADPEGQGVTENVYLMKDGENTVTVDGGLLFYDDGGPDQKYSKDFNGTTVFRPAKEGDIIRLTVRQFYTRYNEYLDIYSGSGVNADNQLAHLSSSMSDDKLATAIYLSKAEDGCVTCHFETSNNYNDGWEILVESFTPQPMAVSSVELTPVNDNKMLRGSVDNKMMKVAVTASGEKGTVDLSAFNFSSLESDVEYIKSARLYYTGTLDTFSTATLWGQAELTAEAAFTITGSTTLDAAGTYYYWLTYDIAAEALNDSKIQAEFTSLTANDATVAPAEGKQVLVTVQDGVHGTYTIGTSGSEDFATIQAAIDSLEGGIDGPVEFLIADGNYKELVNLPQVTGSSPENTVTLRSASGKRENVIITYDNYTDPGSSSYSQRYGVVTFTGMDYVTLRDVTVTDEDQDFPAVVFLRDNSDYVTLDNLYLHLPVFTSYTSGNHLVYTYAPNESPNRDCDYLTVRNCLFEGGYIGMNLSSNGYIALPQQKGCVVENNIFRNQGSKAIYVSSSEGATIRGNAVYSDGNTTSSYWALDLNGTGGDFTAEANTVYMENPISSAIGIYLRMTSQANFKPGFKRIYNNEINIVGSTTAVTGFRQNDDIDGLEFVHNTIRIQGTGAAYGIYIGGTTKDAKYMNNLIQNETTGTTGTSGRIFHVGRDTYMEGEFSHNVYYSTNENRFYVYDPMDTETWNTTVGNQTNVIEATEFLSETVLEPAAAGSLVSAQPIEWLTTDLYGAERAAVPTVGCYEYAESTVAPAMAEGMPEVTDVTHDTATLNVQSTLTATMAYVVLEADAEAPTAEYVKGEDQTITLRKGVTARVPVSGLDPKTTYKAYMVLTSLRGMDSDVIATDGFTTTAVPSPEPLPLTATIDFDGTAVQAGSEVSLPVTVDGGVEPYTYEWTNALHEAVGSANPLALTPEVSQEYTVKVTDARGATATATVQVRVLGEQKIATFDDLYLEPESNWHGNTEDEDYMMGSFFSGSFEFNNSYMADWDSWSFFGYSNMTSTGFSSYLTDQYNSAVGHGVDDSANFGVVFISPYMGKTLMTLSNTTEGQTIPGMYVTNSAWDVDAILNGDGYEPKFDKDDYLMLNLTGTRADGTTTTLDVPLADYRYENEADRWYLDTWQWIDLSPLGDVVSVEWNMSSTKANAYGMTTPSYLCIDNVGASCPVKEGEQVLLKVNSEEPQASFDLARYFSFQPTEGTVTYSVVGDKPEALTIAGDGTATVNSGEAMEFTVTVRANQRGCNEWVSIPVKVETKPLGIDGVEMESVALYPNPADTYVTVCGDAADYTVAIISMDGREVARHEGLNGRRTLNISDLTAGTYLVRFSAADGSAAVRKLLVK